MSEMARVIRPVDITPDLLTASNVPEDDYPLWNGTTAYVAGDQRILDHVIYKAATANTNRNPATDTVFPAAWVKVGATNRYRMFDEKVGTVTTRLNGVDVTITPPDFIDSVTLLNLWGNAARLTITDAAEGEVYQEEVSLVAADVNDWWEYFFEPITRRSDVVLTDLPLYAGAEIRIEIIVADGDTASIGSAGMGLAFDIGRSLWGSSVSIRDYSVKEFDDFGNLSILQRDWSKRPEFDLIIDTDRGDEVLNELVKLRAKPCVYIGHKNYTSLISLGFFRELMTVLSGHAVSECTLTIEGLT